MLELTHVTPEYKQKLRELGMQAAGADSARERRLAREQRYELLLRLEPELVVHESTMYNGKPVRTTVQDQIDLLRSGM